MNYLEEQRNPLKNLPGLLIVGGAHVVLIYLLVVVLGKNTIEKLVAPIETKIIKEEKAPPPPPPPPPPPDLAPPPPQAYIPPPEIQVQPPPPTNNAIVAVKTAPTPPNFVKTPTPAAPPDETFSAAHVVSGSRSPDYPDQYQDSGRTGKVTVQCTIETDGRPTNCVVLNTVGGSAFTQATLGWLNGSHAPRYRPESRGGHPVASQHAWAVTFQQAD